MNISPPTIKNNKKRERALPSSKDFIKNKDFFQAILEYKEGCKKALIDGKEKPRLSPYIGKCILILATRLSTKPCYIGYAFRTEMVGDAIENCILYFDSFDPYHINDEGKHYSAFAYFTEICQRAFWRRIAEEKKKQYTKYKYFQVNILNTESADLLHSDENQLTPHESYDNMNTFVEEFEEKEEIKKLKKAQKVIEKREALANNPGGGIKV